MDKKLLDDRLYIRINREDKLKLIEESIDAEVTLSEYILGKIIGNSDTPISGHLQIDILWAINSAVLFNNYLLETTDNDSLRGMYTENIVKLKNLAASIRRF